MDDRSDKSIIKKKVIIFGVFDGLHQGHLYFIKKAKEKGHNLMVIVAPDDIVKVLKGKYPKHNQKQRIEDLSKIKEIDSVFLGDQEMGSYNVLRKIKPDIIFLGYDQQELYQNLKEMINNKNLEEVEIIFNNSAYQPEIFHSSIIAGLGSSF